MGVNKIQINYSFEDSNGRITLNTYIRDNIFWRYIDLTALLALNACCSINKLELHLSPGRPTNNKKTP